MKKEKILKLKKELVTYSMLSTIGVTSLTGCSETALIQDNTQAPMTTLDMLQEDEYSLINDNSKYIVRTKNADGTISSNFVQKVSLRDIQYDWYGDFSDDYLTDIGEYSKYHTDNKSIVSFPSDYNTYLYIDLFSGDVILAEYVKKNTNLLNGIEYDSTYLVGEVEEITQAIEYASKYIGFNKLYSSDSIKKMMLTLNK